jgi:lysophospholipid acyltransferase (LPLAT)-like uncharacterized protein
LSAAPTGDADGPVTATRAGLLPRSLIGGVLLSNYLRLVALTSRLKLLPAGQWQAVDANWPVIFVSWHGHSNLAYVYTPRRREWSILASTHPDGRIAAALAHAFGYQTIDGSGMSERQRHGTGGVGAFRAMLRAVKAGRSLFLTADVPPVPGRQISPGVIAIARRSGRPMFAMATASSKRKILDRVWDKMQINLPFSTTTYVFEEPISMTDPAISDDEYADALRVKLDRALERALAVADGRAES